MATAYEVPLFAHHYVDGSGNTNVTDTRCPQSASVTKAAGRIFAVNGETVRYCAIGSARDWTTASDAGFLPTSLQQDTNQATTGVGTYQGSLVAFFPEGAQIWKVAADPSANEITKRVAGVGTKAPRTGASFASDFMFLSPYGFRSMTVQATSDRIDDTDVGVAVDALVAPDIPDDSTIVTSTFGKWIPQFGQYWCVIPGVGTTRVWAYTFSRSSKIACWSQYDFPVVITGIATLEGRVYVRDATTLYEVRADQYTDGATSIPVEVRMAFQNAKTPGVEKQWYGADFVFSGTADVSYLYDPRDTTKESTSQEVTGDTAPGVTVGVEIVAASVAPVIRHEADEAFEFDSVTLYYNPLGVT